MQLIPVPVLINGNSYAWDDIQLSIAGSTPISGITEINYGYKRKMDPIYGAGSEPVSYGYGNKEYTASITIKMEEAQVILQASPNGDITQIPLFPIVVAWLDTDNLIVTNILKNCKFMNYEIKTKQNDTSTDMVMNIMFAGLTI